MVRLSIEESISLAERVSTYERNIEPRKFLFFHWNKDKGIVGRIEGDRGLLTVEVGRPYTLLSTECDHKVIGLRISLNDRIVANYVDEINSCEHESKFNRLYDVWTHATDPETFRRQKQKEAAEASLHNAVVTYGQR